MAKSFAGQQDRGLLETLSQAIADAHGCALHDPIETERLKAEGIEKGLLAALSMILVNSPMNWYMQVGFGGFSQEAVEEHKRLCKERLHREKTPSQERVSPSLPNPLPPTSLRTPLESSKIDSFFEIHLPPLKGGSPLLTPFCSIP